MVHFNWKFLFYLTGASTIFSQWTNKSFQSLAQKAIYERIKQDWEPSFRKKPLLCVVFADASRLMRRAHKSGAQKALEINMDVMKSYCEFAILSYSCPVGAIHYFSNLASSAKATLALYRCVKPVDFKSTFVSKVMMYNRLLSIVRGYQRIWFLDEDISLVHFQPEKFFHTLNCAFWPRIPPFVVQPLITESTQDYDFVNLNTWKQTNVIAAETTFIEIQVPMFNATFLEWFIEYLVAPLTLHRSQALLNGGFDSMFCKSADYFARILMGNSSKGFRPCAVITATGTSVSHLNLKTIDKSGTFRQKNIKQAHELRKIFPDMLSWNFKMVNGIYTSPNFSKWEKVKRVPEECPNIYVKKLNPKVNKSRQKRVSHQPLHKKLEERFPNVVIPKNVSIASMGAGATRVLALYFPQFHSDPLNDFLWGRGYSDWDNVLSAPTINNMRDPIMTPTELGYYDLLQKSTRREQANFARFYGVDGFIYHHYWFYDIGLSATLSAPLEALLSDGEPNLDFALHWCNQNWTATWQGQVLTRRAANARMGNLLQAQNYPQPDDPQILDHYNFLRRFFHHRNYIKVKGVPLFMVFCTFDRQSWPILQRLRELAMEDGFPSPGLHIPQFRVNAEHQIVEGRIPLKHRNTTRTLEQFDSDFYYPSNHNFLGHRVPTSCVAGTKGPETRPVYLSTITTFDNTPRRGYEFAVQWDRKWSSMPVPKFFERDLIETMMYERCCQSAKARENGGKFVVVNAWNEWGEGMALEPSDVYGRGFLEAVRNAKRAVAAMECNWEMYKVIHEPIS